jgi:hypothetical protein
MKAAKPKQKLTINPILFEQIYDEISPEITETFTVNQMEAIKNAYKNLEWQNHPVDVRISVPIPIIPFYLVLLAGEERRSKQRRQHEKSLYPFLTTGNIFLLLLFAFIIISGTISSFLVIKPQINNHLNYSFPTEIPWIDNQQDCEQFNRNWQDGKCWDHQHSSSF